MKKKELEKLIKDYPDMGIRLLELKERLGCLEAYSGVGSVKLDQMVAGGQGKTICDIISDKDNLKAEIVNLELKLNKVKYALLLLDKVELNIILALYGRYKIPIQELEGTKRVNYYSKSTIYRKKDDAIQKMLNYINNN